MNNKTIKAIAFGLVLCLVLSYVIYHVVLYSKSDMETQVALTETVYETINADCFVLRDEEYIENNATGTTVSFVKNGERVAAGDTVSMIFNNSQDADTYLKITELEKEIAHYNDLSSQANIRTLDLTSLEAKINSELCDYLDALDTLDYQAAFEYSDELRSSLTSKQIETGVQIDYSEKLASLKNELSELKNKSLSYSSVTTSESGYFISGFDGYENTLDFDSLDDYTCEDIKNAIKASPADVSENVIGRAVSDFNWYILCVVPTEKTVNLENGQELFVNFPYSGIAMLQTELVKIGSREGDETELILRCDLMNERLTGIRIENIEIVTEEYTGYKLKNTAIRTVDGETGVYVVRGNLLSFVKVYILYSDEEFSVVNNPDGEFGYIKNYDTVVTKGVELYDNKLV